eukprot:jgi/Chlat1/8120/Chrsp75S07596
MKVLKGMGLVREMENAEKDANDRPIKEIVIADCGEIGSGEEDGMQADDGYPDWPEDIDISNSNKTDAGWWLAAAEKIKDIGNTAFKAGDYNTAARKYQKAQRYIKHTQGLGDLDESQSTSLKALRSSCLLNKAACDLKLKNYESVVDGCSAALAYEPQSAKALFRRGQARVALKQYEDAVEDLTKAAALEPNDAGIKNELAKVKRGVEEARKRERATYARMFQ